MRWSRAAINFGLDATALTVLLTVLWTRIVAFYVVPTPRAGESALVLWGLDHAGWDALNFWLTMAFAIVILVHLILHWTWVSQFVHQRVKRWTRSRTVLNAGTQTMYGVGFLILVLMTAGSLLAVAAVAARPL